MSQRITVGGLQIAKPLHDLLKELVAPGTGIEPEKFWAALERIVAELEPINRALLNRRDELQAKIDAWHQVHQGKPHDPSAYRRFLVEIGYLVPEGEDFSVSTAGVDSEIAMIAGPQLVVPVNNARYALNAANARWGSLYDSLYGTDVINEADGCGRAGAYNPKRGER